MSGRLLRRLAWVRSVIIRPSFDLGTWSTITLFACTSVSDAPKAHGCAMIFHQVLIHYQASVYVFLYIYVKDVDSSKPIFPASLNNHPITQLSPIPHSFRNSRLHLLTPPVFFFHGTPLCKYLPPVRITLVSPGKQYYSQSNDSP